MLYGIIGCCDIIVMLVLFIKVHVRVRVIINVFDVPMVMLVLLMLYYLFHTDVRVTVVNVMLCFLRYFHVSNMCY